MPGARRRYLAFRPAGRARARRDYRRARQARRVRLRQRHRADQHGDPALVAGERRRMALYYIAPGKPQQNAFIESFNGRLRDELLNETLFGSLAHARVALAEWRLDYNTVRPHSSLGKLPPVDYVKLSVPASQRDGTLRAIEGSAPRPVAASSQVGSNGPPILLIPG